MNSALKPVLPQPGVPPGAGGQASPAKANVATANHTVGLPQGAQNSLPSLVGQNLTQPAPVAPPPAHPAPPAPSMAPVSANMAQMAQNMSHHGNLSHVTQNSVAPPPVAVSPNKAAPLSLVQDKPQPLALTRTPDKKEPEAPGQANGTIESPKLASNAPVTLKAQNLEPTKDKLDIAKTSPSTPKPPEKPHGAPSTPQKAEPVIPVSQAESPAQPKVATANEAPEKSPSKPTEPKPAPTADVAPSQIDSKPVPESANDSQLQEKPLTSQKAEPAPAESAKVDPPKPEEKKEEPKVEKPAANALDQKKEEVKVEPPKKEEALEKKEKELKPQKPEEKEKPEEKKAETKVETKAALKAEPKATPRSTMKLATVTPAMRKRRHASPKANEQSSAKKSAGDFGTPDPRSKRNRTQVQLYQSPTPELTMATKLSASAGRATPTKPGDDKLIVFYKNEYLAVRNAEGSFYVCQAMQNVHRATRKIKIRWLSQDKAADPSGETYKPDFYDVTDMECVLTTLSLTRAPAGGGAQILKPVEEARARSILERALRAEQSGGAGIQLTEEHPDGLDLSLYKDESQLEKKSRKRGAKGSPRAPHAPHAPSAPADDSDDEIYKFQDEPSTPQPLKRARASKRSPPSARKAPPPPKPLPTMTKPISPMTKRPTAGSTTSASKTATAVIEKSKVKATPPKPAPAKRTPPKRSPAKRAPAKPASAKAPAAAVTAPREGRRAAAKEPKPAPAPTPSTSTGKATRTPRKPPAKK